MSSDTVLRCCGIRKSFGEGGTLLRILEGIDLEIRRGEVVAVTGPSGSGKSTLLNILGILEPPDSGTVEIAGRDAWRASERVRASIRNRNLGFVFQFHHLLEEFTIIENVMMPLLIAGSSHAAASGAAAGMLSHVGLEGRSEHFPSQVSGGERQRAAVARALVTGPDVVLADEPTGNLDAASGDRLKSLVGRLARDLGQAFVIATHSPSLASGADRVFRLASGRLYEGDDLCGA